MSKDTSFECWAETHWPGERWEEQTLEAIRLVRMIDWHPPHARVKVRVFRPELFYSVAPHSSPIRPFVVQVKRSGIVRRVTIDRDAFGYGDYVTRVLAKALEIALATLDRCVDHEDCTMNPELGLACFLENRR